MASFRSTTGVLLLAFVQIITIQNCFCTDNHVFRTQYQVPKVFGQNLTKEIEKVLKENDATQKTVIKEALQWSQIVYYESDILLQNIEDIIPVIDLLNELTPNSSLPVKLSLSLRYTNRTNGQILWSRMGDVYYNLEAKITPLNRTKILKSLASITLNFVSFHDPVFKYGNKYKDFQFVNCDKNFVSLYFRPNTISVGIMGNSGTESSSLFRMQNLNSDFSIFYSEFHLDQKFPIFMEKLDNFVTQRASHTILVKKIGQQTQEMESLWKQDNMPYQLRYALQKTPQYKNISEQFVRRISKKSTQLFDYILLAWAKMKNQDIIIGNTMQNLSTEIFPNPDLHVKLIVPYIEIEEGEIDVCIMRNQFAKWITNYETVLLDEISWRALARFRGDITDDLLKCNGSTTNSGNSRSLNVFIQFTSGVAQQWEMLEPYFFNLINTYPTISNLALDTVIFHDEDINNSLEIQRFVKKLKQTHRVGCSIQYQAMFIAVSQFLKIENKYLEDTLQMSLENFTCKPIFKLLDVMIWNAPSDENPIYRNDRLYYRDRVFSAYSNIFLLREVFQNLFPQINVYIKFDSDFDKRIMANLFDAPIIVSSDQILY